MRCFMKRLLSNSIERKTGFRKFGEITLRAKPSDDERYIPMTKSSFNSERSSKKCWN